MTDSCVIIPCSEAVMTDEQHAGLVRYLNSAIESLSDEGKEETIYLKDSSDTSSTFKAPNSLHINTEFAKLLESMFETEYYETGIANKSEKFFKSSIFSESPLSMKPPVK